MNPPRNHVTRFVYITDTHVSTGPIGYVMQKGYHDRQARIVAALRKWIEDDGRIDFIIHGGDAIDVVEERNIRRTKRLFSFSVPMYLCLGNHDIATRESLKMWLDIAPAFFPGNRPDFQLNCGDCVVHVMPTQWSDADYWSKGEQNPRFAPAQLKFFEKHAVKYRKLPLILCTHSDIFGMPPEQSGYDGPFHQPPMTFTRPFVDFVAKWPRVKCVLSGHTHYNMRVKAGAVHYVTASALPETPFEFKLFEIGKGAVKMSTVSLFSRMPFSAEYDFNRTLVQGRERDRAFEEKL